MARRDWPFMVQCGHEGCSERATYRYSTKRDMMTSFEVKHYSNGKWRCTRHTRPDEVLSRENPKTRVELVVEQKPYGLTFGHSSFLSGPGFKAFADDLGAGAKIIITAELVIEEESNGE